MSDLAQASLISGGLFAIVMLTQFGRRTLTFRMLLRPVLLAGGIGYYYLSDMPLKTSGEWTLYAAGLAVGLLFAAGTTLATRIEVDATTGKVVTICGAGFVAVWVLAVAARLAFVYSTDHISWVRENVGTFLADHRIEQAAIAPFFVIWALTMVVARVAAVQIGAHQARTGRRPVII